MTTTSDYVVFAGHSDFLNAAAGFDQKAALTGSAPGAPPAHDLALGHGVVGGLFEVLVPPDPPSRLLQTADGMEVEYPPPLNPDTALREVLRGISALIRLSRQPESPVRIVTGADELGAVVHAGRFAGVLHLADADAIDEELTALDTLVAAGLRSLALTWSRANGFGYGVPYRSPGHPEIGPGLSPAGQQLVRRCNELGVLVDLAHLNAAGFRDVARISRHPLVITHGAAHALSPTSRAATDDQLRAIAASDGVIGISLEGVPPTEAGIVADMVNQIDYVGQLIGPRHVTLGTDLYRSPNSDHPDGHIHIPELLAALADQGYPEPALADLTHRNWHRVLTATWTG